MEKISLALDEEEIIEFLKVWMSLKNIQGICVEEIDPYKRSIKSEKIFSVTINKIR